MNEIPDHRGTEDGSRPSGPLSTTTQGRVPALDHETGLPGLRSWRTVYTVVFGVFLFWLGLLTWLTEHYST